MLLRQYMATLEDEKTDNKDRAISDTLEEVVINVTSGPTDSKKKDKVNKNTFSRTAP